MSPLALHIYFRLSLELSYPQFLIATWHQADQGLLQINSSQQNPILGVACSNMPYMSVRVLLLIIFRATAERRARSARCPARSCLRPALRLDPVCLSDACAVSAPAPSAVSAAAAQLTQLSHRLFSLIACGRGQGSVYY